jgi:hypothetical protein
LEAVMRIFRKIVKNVLPYCLVKKYQSRYGGDPFKPGVDAFEPGVVPWEPGWEPGGFYSPIPSMEDIKNHNFKADLPSEIPGIDLNTYEQMNLLNSFERYYNELPFSDNKTDGLRFYYKNDYYGYSDAIFLYCMLRHLKPHNIIEVGSGFSSSVTLDTNEKFMQNKMHCSFIEPYPDRLKSLLKNGDTAKITIYEKRLQEIPLDVFRELSENDILFIDSTHVSKVGSDVNYVIHTLLPKLAKGVHIHFHDMFYPFEYPETWLLQGRAFNEQYILRAFLEYNNAFKIVLFNTYLQWKFKNVLEERFPLIYKNTGASIWIKKI